jgi:hypothetical protein
MRGIDLFLSVIDMFRIGAEGEESEEEGKGSLFN